MPYEQTLGAMKALAPRIAKITNEYKEYGHPIDVNHALEAAYLAAAADVSKELKLDQPIPKLCTLVTASPFDAALHDAYGKLHGRSVYQTYGREFMARDLSFYLGKEYKGEYLDKYVLREPQPFMPIYHSVGASDPIFAEDIQKRVGDGLPETLPEWIARDGITHIKIKLNGEDRNWDIERVVRIDRAAPNVSKLSLDFNEKCPNVEYLIAVMESIKQKTPRGFNKIQYVEQPTKRDLKADRHNVMHEAAKLRPVVIDESLVDQETLLLSREMGYTGAALKACKGQSQAMLMAAAAQKHKMFLCVQDLTCPGAAFVHSAGIAAHVPGVAGVEANAREYVPIANKPWETRLPGIFHIQRGGMRTGTLTGHGLGAV
jgi:L-alanine-DL-glutamate epimerase-like enolase superfamily enzyme